MVDVRDEVVELAASVDRLLEADIDGRPVTALGEDLVSLRRSIDRLEAEFTRRLRRFDAGGGPQAEAAVTPVAWLRNACNMTGAAARDRVEIGRTIGDLPAVELAFRAGAIGVGHAAVIARSVEEVGLEAVRDSEATLVEAAMAMDAGRLRIVTRHLRYCVDPDGALQDDRREHARRWLQLNTLMDGIVHLDARLDAESGAIVRTAIEALMEPPRQGEYVPAAAARADALVEIARRQLQGGQLPTAHGQRPHLTVIAPAETLRGEPGSPAADLLGSGPIHPATAQRLACDASITTIFMTADGEMLGASATAPVIPAALRTALVARDRGCRFPGCDRPPEWTDGHHIQHRAHGGRNVLSNLVLLCRQHHRHVHEEGYSLRWGPDHTVELVPP